MAAWVERRDEVAFRRLVDGHAALVIAACRRQLGNSAAAEEAAQAVFIILAQRAGTIANPQALESWLYGVALGVCRNSRRAAARRARHEQDFAMCSARRQAGVSTPSVWTDLRPQLDEAIAALSVADREMVVGHFLQGLPAAAVAAHLGISENAARKRISSVLGRLRSWFSKRGMSVGAGVLVVGLMSEAGAAEPALAAACVKAALQPASAGGAAALANGTMKAWAGKQVIMAVVAAAAVICATGTILSHFVTRPSTGISAVVPDPPSASSANGMVQVPSPWARWPKGIPSDPGFFPIGVWLQDPADAAAYRQAGINLYVNLWNGPTAADLAALSAAGMRTICAQNEVALQERHEGTVVGWMGDGNPDEAVADGRGGYGPPTSASQVIERYHNLRRRDPSRPVYLLLGQGAAWDDYAGRGTRTGHPEDYSGYAEGGDILDFHFYPVNHPDPRVSGALRYVPQGVERLRRWSGDAKPVWCGIECTRIFAESAGKPSPQQVRSEVWMALIRGARGFVYFCHVLSPAPGDPAALLHDPVMLPAITALNHQIADLAPVLNSPTVADGTTVVPDDGAVRLDALVKHCAGARYVFVAALGDGVTTATCSLPSGGRVEVLGEDRIITVDGGRFRDVFRSHDVHLYRIRDVDEQH